MVGGRGTFQPAPAGRTTPAKSQTAVSGAANPELRRWIADRFQSLDSKT
jgi:hypothetical protein